MLPPLEFLWLPALCVAIFGPWVLVKVVRLSRWSALTLGVIKAAIPFVYFAYYYDGSWNLVDDVWYFKGGERMMSRFHNPLLSLFTQAGRDQLIAIAGGTQILYVWWNQLALYLFGTFYSSPIFLNVATTFVSAALMFKIALASGCNEKYAKWLSIFFLLHWDILSWSSFVNLKDTLVLMLTLAAVHSGMRFVQTRKIRHAVMLAGAVFAFLWIRFYIPVLLLVCLAAWAAFVAKGYKKILLMVIALAGVLIVLPADAFESFQDLSRGEWIYGPIQMALSPQPWSIMPEYSFLLIPSICHWVFFFPGLVAGVSLFRRNPAFRFAAIYFVAIIFFYGLLPYVRGVRERFQISWVFVWMQFDFLWFSFFAVLRKLPARTRIAMGHHVRRQIAQKI